MAYRMNYSQAQILMNQEELTFQDTTEIAATYEMKIQKFQEHHYYQAEASNHSSTTRQENARVWSQGTNKLI